MARPAYAAARRDRLRPILCSRIDAVADLEVVDTFFYGLFLSLFLTGSTSTSVMLFRPWGNDPHRSVLEMMLITWPPPGTERPRPPPVRWLADDEYFTSVRELGSIGAFANQDIANLEGIMEGLHNNRRKRLMLARHQELMIRHFFHLWSGATGRSAGTSTSFPVLAIRIRKVTSVISQRAGLRLPRSALSAHRTERSRRRSSCRCRDLSKGRPCAATRSPRDRRTWAGATRA